MWKIPIGFKGNPSKDQGDDEKGSNYLVYVKPKRNARVSMDPKTLLTN